MPETSRLVRKGEWETLYALLLDDTRRAWAEVKESWLKGGSEQALAYMTLDTVLGVDADGHVMRPSPYCGEAYPVGGNPAYRRG